MTDRPTDAQLRGLAVIDAGMLQDDRTANWYITDADLLKFARAVLAKFGTPPPAVAREPQYRLLQSGMDRIEPADEFLAEDARTWAADPGGIFVGMIYGGRVLRPARRAILKEPQ